MSGWPQICAWKGFAHRDLKPENILVESLKPFKIRIADFGDAKETSFSFKSYCGTECCMAPEIFDSRSWGNPRYSVACDIWSLGTLISELLFRRPEWYWPFHRGYCEKIVKHVQRPCQTHLERLKQLLLGSLLVMNPEERATAAECYALATALPLADCQPEELLSSLRLQALTGVPASRFPTAETDRIQEDDKTVRPPGAGKKNNQRGCFADSLYNGQSNSQGSKRHREDDPGADQNVPPSKRPFIAGLVPSSSKLLRGRLGASRNAKADLEAWVLAPDRESQVEHSEQAARLSCESSKSGWPKRRAVMSEGPTSPVQGFIHEGSPVMQSIEWPSQDTCSQDAVSERRNMLIVVLRTKFHVFEVFRFSLSFYPCLISCDNAFEPATPILTWTRRLGAGV